MDQISFHHDTVLSDVHMLVPNTCHLMIRLNSVGQPVFTSKFKILSDGERLEGTQKSQEDVKKDTTATEREAGEEAEGNVVPGLDEDGDLDITRRPRRNTAEGASRDSASPVILKQCSPVLELEDQDLDDDGSGDTVRIEHTMATPLEDVGKQVWRGAFLLADFILSEPATFRGATVLELGAGTGLTSIVMATLAKRVYSTDVGEDLLSMCKRNVTLNRRMMDSGGGEVRVRRLDWLQYDLCTDTDEFSWTEEDEADLYDNTSVIIAADVCYDDDLTDGFFQTLYRLCSHFTHSCSIFISLEKRMNFTLRHMDVSCEAYDHFRRCLSQLPGLVDGRCSFTVEQLPCDFSQFLLYERIDQLELWKVTAKYSASGRSRADSATSPTL